MSVDLKAKRFYLSSLQIRRVRKPEDDAVNLVKDRENRGPWQQCTHHQDLR